MKMQFFSKILTLVFIAVPIHLFCEEQSLKEPTLMMQMRGLFSMVLDANTMTSQYHFRCGPKNETFIVFDGIYCDIDNLYSSPTAFPSGFNLDDIYWDEDGNAVFSDSTSIYFYDCNKRLSFRLLDNNSTKINFRIGNSGIYFYHSDDSCLYVCRYENQMASELVYKFDGVISDVKIKGNNCIVAFGHQFAFLSGDDYIPLIESTEIINSVEADSTSFFYGTSKGLYLLDTEHHVKIGDGNIRELSIIDNSMYIIQNDNSSIKISDITTLHELLSFNERHIHINDVLNSNVGSLLIGADEMNISDGQLCIIPNNGIYLLTGQELISLEENSTMPILKIYGGLLADEVIATGENVLIKNDTTIFSCKDFLEPLFNFDTNSYSLYPTTDGNIFILSKCDSLCLLFAGNVITREMEPLGKMEEDIVFVAGDTIHKVVVTTNNIYSFQDKEGIRMYNHFEPIITATLTQYGLIFATENGIFLLEGMNHVALIADKGCRRLLSDINTLYVYYDDGTLLAYRLDLLRQGTINED